MTAPDGFDRRITAWLEEQAPMREPDDLLRTVELGLARTRRLPGWVLLERWIPMQTQAKLGAIPRSAIILVSLGLLAALLTVIAIGAQPTRPPAPFGPARNGLLLFEKAGDLWLADADGANHRPVTTGPEIDEYQAFSHDGTRIQFLRRQADDTTRLMVAKADGTGIVPLTPAVEYADFSPDDSRLVASHLVDGEMVISIVDPDPAVPPQTLELGDIQPMGWLAWRPEDGREIVFLGHPQAGPLDRGFYAIGADGSGLRQIGELRTNESDPSEPAPARISFQDPALSPDGSSVGYWNWDTSLASVFSYLRDLDTGEDRVVAPNTNIVRFSPDGEWVISEEPSGGPIQLVVVPLEGSEPQRLIGPTYTQDDTRAFDFSPDGTKVLLILGGRNETWIIDVATGEAEVTKEPIPTLPSWQRLAP